MSNRETNPANELQRDANGNVIANPLTGWDIGPIADIAVLLAIQYVSSPEEFAKEHRRLQLALMPQQALELSEALKRWASQILAPSQSGKAPN